MQVLHAEARIRGKWDEATALGPERIEVRIRELDWGGR